MLAGGLGQLVAVAGGGDLEDPPLAVALLAGCAQPQELDEIRSIAEEVSTLREATENATSFGDYDGIRTRLGVLSSKCEDLIEARQNFRRQPNDTNKKMLESVKSRLRYFDVGASEIEQIMKKETVKHALTIRSPYSGVVTEKNILEGDYVKSGTTLYKIADLSTVWVEAHIYEYELTGVKKGQPVEMTLPYLPGKKYLGEVAYVYPYLQRQTRDVVVRLEFDNPELTLKPDMYGDVRIRTTFGKKGIHVPDSAVIRSGERNIAFVRRAPGKFTPREVELGMPLDNDRIQILQGLAPGEQVVVSGQFLLDSESKLQEGTRKMKKPETEGEEADTAGPEDTDGFFEELEGKDNTKKKSEGESFFEDLE